MAKGRCETCQGEGVVCVELLCLPSVYAACPTCKGTRYNAKTLEIKTRERLIADMLDMAVDEAFEFFADADPLRRSLGVLREVGLGYIRLGQSATELSGGEAQRVKLATELQPAQRVETLYVLDEPKTGLHPSDVAKLMRQVYYLVEAGNTVIVVEHDMTVAAASDWIIGPGAGGEGGRIVVSGTPGQVAKESRSRTAKYLAAVLSRRKQEFDSPRERQI
jgi:excinuclease ABC subunit A